MNEKAGRRCRLLVGVATVAALMAAPIAINLPDLHLYMNIGQAKDHGDSKGDGHGRGNGNGKGNSNGSSASGSGPSASNGASGSQGQGSSSSGGQSDGSGQSSSGSQGQGDSDSSGQSSGSRGPSSSGDSGSSGSEGEGSSSSSGGQSSGSRQPASSGSGGSQGQGGSSSGSSGSGSSTAGSGQPSGSGESASSGSQGEGSSSGASGESSGSGQSATSGSSASQGQGNSSSSGQPSDSSQSTSSSDSTTDTASSGSGDTGSAVSGPTSTSGSTAPTKTPPRAYADFLAPRLAASASQQSGPPAVAVTVAIESVRVHFDGNHNDRSLPETDAPSTATEPPQPSSAAPLTCAEASVAPCATLASLPPDPNLPEQAPGTARPALRKQLAYAVPGPGFDKEEPKPNVAVFDEIYGLVDVQATQYSDPTTTPILVVQGLVTNMSRSSRHVPPLLAIVWDKDGHELKRWKFSAELPTLSPGGSTGFRSEAMAPTPTPRR